MVYNVQYPPLIRLSKDSSIIVQLIKHVDLVQSIHRHQMKLVRSHYGMAKKKTLIWH